VKKVNFTDVNPLSKKEAFLVKKEIINTIKKKDFILGQNVIKFEKRFSDMSNSRYAIGCANGTDALILALKSLNLKKNHEIIIPGMTYISTGLCVALNNLKLIFADVDDDTGLISFESIKKKLSKNTRAIIPVNLYGQKVDIKLLRKIVGKKIFIIEDSAQSHFASNCKNCKKNSHLLCYKKEKNHKYSDLSCYSFYPAKNLGAYGDAGLVTTNNINLYKKISILRNLGTVKKNVHLYEGINSRLDTLQASILLKKINLTPKYNNYRRKISNYYDEELGCVGDIKLTITDPGSSRHLYVIRTKYRDKLGKFLKSKNVHCQIHYAYSMNKAGALRAKAKNIKLPTSERWAKKCISLPLHPRIKISEVNYVIKIIKKFFAKNGKYNNF
tara:strand:- start:4191 stop:5348 length:1158 start_codon:yes stop_codon:yes gene_type:complete